MRFSGSDIVSIEVDIDDDDLRKTVAAESYPEDVFSESDLERWARENDFIKKEEAREK